MRRFERPPEPARFTKRARDARTGLAELDASERSDHIDKKAAVWRDFKASYIDAQRGVCAYCEHDTAASSHGDVEHFRPKGAIRLREDGAPLTATAAPPALVDKTASEEGYWWLAFEWSNYMFACQICNEAWKRDQFPLATPADRTTWGEGYRCDSERPQLLDPFEERFEPSQHFEYVDDGGGVWQIRGRDERGNATIAACGLHRSALRTARNNRLKEVPSRVDAVIAALRAVGPGADRETALRWLRLGEAWDALTALFTISSFLGDVRVFADQLLRAELKRGVTALDAPIRAKVAEAKRLLGRSDPR
jgi:hypothetical protein